MLEDVVGSLRCPHCLGDLTLGDGVARCTSGHAFDVARQGYLNLLPGDARTGTADTAAMVRARDEFLAAGHYTGIADAVAAACAAVAADSSASDATSGEERDGGRSGASDGPAIDVGAGTGYYLAAALDRLPGRPGLALDISKHALRRAARAHPRIGAVGCDAWRGLPVRDGATDLALSVFAPRDPAELARVLVPQGALIVVTPTRRHLAELVSAVGMLTVQERKRERLEGKLAGLFAAVEETAIESRLSLGHGDLLALVVMGPSARHLGEQDVAARVGELPDPFEVTLSVRLATYRRLPGSSVATRPADRAGGGDTSQP